MIKYVYSIISSKDDYIVEQAFLSMYSLKLHNPEAEITLVTDETSFNSLSGNRARIKEYVDKIVIENPPQDFTPTEKSRFLKTSLRRLISGDFLYLDNDTIIMNPLKDLEEFPGEMGAIKDHHRDAVKDGRVIHGQILNYLYQTKKNFWNYPVYYNGGIFLVRDTKATHKFFEDWHRLWMEDRQKYGLQLDQPTFAQANHLNNYLISEINGEFNTQIIFVEHVLAFFSKVKIVHYFANADRSKYFPLNQKEVLETIRKKGIYKEIEELINYPMKGLLNKVLILTGKDRDLYYTPAVTLARILGGKHKWIQNFTRFLFKIKGLPI